MCSFEGNKAVDASNMCWYHECILGENGLQFMARQCAGMSKVSYNFVQGEHNPCTVNYEADDGKGNISHKNTLNHHFTYTEKMIRLAHHQHSWISSFEI